MSSNKSKIILTVDSQYVDWGISQGIRELMQNAIDAQTKGYELSVSYSEANKTLRLVNKGISIPKSSLLLGYSTKKGDNTQIGEFGEGYKLGCMALVKQGMHVTVETRDERWTPVLEHHTEFERTVLAFNIEPYLSTDGTDSVAFVIGNLEADMWESTKAQFLMFDDKRKYSVIPSGDTEILKGPSYKGRIYIGGILVQHIDDDFEYGYNFQPGTIQIDRDRKMVDRYSLNNATSKVWANLVHHNLDYLPVLEDLLKSGADDARSISYELSSYVLNQLLDGFQDRYGLDVLPVEYESDATEAGHYGKRGKVFHAAYVRALNRAGLELGKVREAYGRESEGTVDLLTLSKREQNNLLKAKAACALAGEIPHIDVCRFAKHSRVQGLYHNATGNVTLNRSILKDYGKTLATLLHEIAHKEGGDGSREHLDEMTRMWVAIATKGKQTNIS